MGGWVVVMSTSHSPWKEIFLHASFLLPFPQVKYILGLKIDRADRIQDYLQLIFDNLWQFK